MAGDWIKMRMSLTREPQVVGIASATGLDVFAVVGRLHAVWAYADEVSSDGKLPYIGKGYIDQMIRHDGFADAMESVKWLRVSGDSLIIPNFDRHNGKSAKSRADAAERQRRSRKSRSKADSLDCHTSVTEMSRGKCDKSVTREEKRREEKSHTMESASEVLHKGQPVNAYIAAGKLLDATGWPMDRRCGDGGTRAITKALLRLADGSDGDDAATDPPMWLGSRMKAAVDSADSARFVPKITKWLTENHPHLVSEGEPV